MLQIPVSTSQFGFQPSLWGKEGTWCVRYRNLNDLYDDTREFSFLECALYPLDTRLSKHCFEELTLSQHRDSLRHSRLEVDMDTCVMILSERHSVPIPVLTARVQHAPNRDNRYARFDNLSLNEYCQLARINSNLGAFSR